MIILDTDCLSLVLEGASKEGRDLFSRLRTQNEPLRATVVTIEESFRGWTTAIARARTDEKLLFAYRRFEELLRLLKEIEVVGFDRQAAASFAGFRKQKIRVGTMDLRIAAIAMSQDATLVTRNLKDFSKIPGLKAEDWIGARQ